MVSIGCQRWGTVCERKIIASLIEMRRYEDSPFKYKWELCFRAKYTRNVVTLTWARTSVWFVWRSLRRPLEEKEKRNGRCVTHVRSPSMIGFVIEVFCFDPGWHIHIQWYQETYVSSSRFINLIGRSSLFVPCLPTSCTALLYGDGSLLEEGLKSE